MSANEKAPIIIKRKKKVSGDGHHGGAWKVAYADFVTAMMAFFMLMWLLNATTESERQGLADYFAPTIAVARVSGGGDGAFGGDSVLTDEILPESGTGGLDEALPGQEATTGVLLEEEQAQEQERLEELLEGLVGSGGESLIADDMREHVNSRLTDEGLIIEIFDLEDDPLFVPATAQPKDVLINLTEIMAHLFQLVENNVAIASHTQSFPVMLRSNPAWDLSTERAHVQRRLLLNAGLPPERVEQVTGFGQQKPYSNNPMAAPNNRLEITLLREN
ncbi:MAG: flagellar motor protein MotB [Litoreibacter sp.]